SPSLGPAVQSPGPPVRALDRRGKPTLDSAGGGPRGTNPPPPPPPPGPRGQTKGPPPPPLAPGNQTPPRPPPPPPRRPNPPPASPSLGPAVQAQDRRYKPRTGGTSLGLLGVGLDCLLGAWTAFPGVGPEILSPGRDMRRLSRRVGPLDDCPGACTAAPAGRRP